MPTLSKDVLRSHRDHEQGNKRCPCSRCREIRRLSGERYRRRHGARPQIEYVSELKANKKHGRASYNRGCRCEVCRTAVNAYLHKRRPPLLLPTIHERAWEVFGIRRAPGLLRHRCKCGCGLFVNTAHVAVLALIAQGYTLHEIAHRLGAPYNTICWIHNQARQRKWPWYRKGHASPLRRVQSPNLRYRVTSAAELKELVSHQSEELRNPYRDGYAHTGRVRTAAYSLDAPLRGTANLTLGDTIASDGEDTVFDEMEYQQAGSLIEQLERVGFTVGQVTEWIEDDHDLGVAFSRALDAGRLSDEIRLLLERHSASVPF